MYMCIYINLKYFLIVKEKYIFYLNKFYCSNKYISIQIPNKSITQKI